MKQTSEGKLDNGQPEIDPGHLLMGWWSRFVSVLSRSRYRESAEDAASTMLVRMVVRGRNGGKLPALPKRLPRRLVQEALSVARHMSRGTAAANGEWEAVLSSDPDPDDSDKAGSSELMQLLERIFTSKEIETMITSCRVGCSNTKDLARMSGLRDRTFRYRKSEARALLRP